MIKPAQYRRLALLALLLLVAFAGLGYRLVDLQVVQHDAFVAQATALRSRRTLRTSERGDIVDANGLRLATTMLVKTVMADPTLIGTNQAVVAAVARTLAPLLKVDEAALFKRLQIQKFKDKEGRERERRSVLLKRKVAFEDWERIRAAMTNLPPAFNLKTASSRQRREYINLTRKAIFVETTDDQMRLYPNGPLAAHVLGHVLTRDTTVDGLVSTELAGMDGIEAKFDHVLNGAVGWKQTEKDAGENELVVFRCEDVASRPGLNVVLTLDAVVQSIVETELAAAMVRHSPVSVSAVVVRPKTGEIVAMATLPNFDPNEPGRGNTPMANLRNRAISDQFEPGSTFKAVVISGALNERIVTLNDHLFCENGRFAYGGHELNDSEHHYGNLSVEEIVGYSSNIGAAKVGLKMGPNLLDEYIRRFGFGERTGILLPGEVRGTLHPIKKWSKVSIVQFPMGQGIAVTPLQMTMAVAAIANGGLLMRPMVVDRVEDEDRRLVQKFQPEPVRQAVEAAAAQFMVQALKRAVSTNSAGKPYTGFNARLEHYTVAGKTGTAQKAPYGSRKYFSSFIGFLPADNPEVCIGVYIDQPEKNGYYGGATAAPVFQRIATRAAVQMGIRPDLATPDEPVARPAEVFSDAKAASPLTPGRSGRNF